MDRFDLFRLPAVAFSEVMKMFSLFDITVLSMCSNRTRRSIKTFRIPRDALAIQVVYRTCAEVCLHNTLSKKKVFYYITSGPCPTYVKLGNTTVPMSIETKDSEYCMNLYFEDQIEGLKTVTEYFCSLFGLDIYSINISRYTILNGPSDVIEWIIQRQKRLSAFWVEHLDASDTVASLLLDKCRIGSSAYINMKVPHQFEFNFKFEGDGYLEIQRGSWFTLENMLNVNCEKLSLRGTSLTNRDINLFLKHWMSTDLKFTQIKIYPEKPMSENVIFTGIPTVRKNTKVYKETEVFAIYKGFQVKRNDGLKTARIMVNHVDPYNRHGLFWMVIWDTV